MEQRWVGVAEKLHGLRPWLNKWKRSQARAEWMGRRNV